MITTFEELGGTYTLSEDGIFYLRLIIDGGSHYLPHREVRQTA